MLKKFSNSHAIRSTQDCCLKSLALFTLGLELVNRHFGEPLAELRMGVDGAAGTRDVIGEVCACDVLLEIVETI